MAVSAAPPRPTLAPSPAVMAIIIDDMGYRRADGLRAIELPGAVTLAFLPHTPYTDSLARLAFQVDKEVMLHLPMEARGGAALGPGGLTASMRRAELQATVRRALAAVPHAVGVSNHMGSLLTPRREPMQWLMETLRETGGLYFVDSHTVAGSVASRVAHDNGLPALRRDVFLDHHRSRTMIRHEMERLVRIARERGRAVGIGHPYPETLDVLDEMLPQLSARGVELVPASALARRRAPTPSWTVPVHQTVGDPPQPPSPAAATTNIR